MHLRNFHNLLKLQGRTRPHSKDSLSATPTRPPSRPAPLCLIIRRENGTDARGRSSIEAKEKSSKAGDGKFRIGVEFKRKSSDVDDGKLGQRIEVKDES